MAGAAFLDLNRVELLLHSFLYPFLGSYDGRLHFLEEGPAWILRDEIIVIYIWSTSI